MALVSRPVSLPNCRARMPGSGGRTRPASRSIGMECRALSFSVSQPSWTRRTRETGLASGPSPQVGRKPAVHRGDDSRLTSFSVEFRRGGGAAAASGTAGRRGSRCNEPSVLRAGEEQGLEPTGGARCCSQDGAGGDRGPDRVGSCQGALRGLDKQSELEDRVLKKVRLVPCKDAISYILSRRDQLSGPASNAPPALHRRTRGSWRPRPS